MHSSGMRTAHLLTVSKHALHGVSAKGVSAQGGLPRECVSQHAVGQTPPCEQTDICENITFANFVEGGKNTLQNSSLTHNEEINIFDFFVDSKRFSIVEKINLARKIA